MTDITQDRSFGGWLRYFRLKKSITLRKAALIVGMDSGNLSKLECSELEPPLVASRVRALCRKLGLGEVAEELLVSLAYQHRLAKFQEDFFK